MGGLARCPPITVRVLVTRDIGQIFRIDARAVIGRDERVGEDGLLLAVFKVLSACFLKRGGG